MTPQLISIYALVAMFAVASIWPINMGVLAFVGAFLVGTLAAGMSAREIIAGFPGSLFLTLVGITFLFAIAQTNGTIDWLVRLAVRAVRGRIAAIPWIMFGITAALTGLGTASPAAVAIIAPIALGFAARHGINPLLMGVFVIHGAQGGGFSPISIYGGITNTIVAQAGLPVTPLYTFFASFAANLGVALLLSLFLRAKKIHGTDTTSQDESHEAPAGTASPGGGSHLYRVFTVIGLLALAVLVLRFQLDIGFTALTIGLLLSFFDPALQKGAIQQVTWPEVMLITGVSTYVAVLEKMGTISFVGHSVAGLTSPLLAALILCLVGAIVSAFASSTAVLGSLIPLAVPFLQSGTGVNPVGFIAAMSVSSTIVDVSPFSTNGAIVLATAKNVNREAFFRTLMVYAAIITLAAPIVAWLLFVVLR